MRDEGEAGLAPLPQTLLVCLCTHQPRRDVLARVLGSVAGQDADPGAFELLLIDNVSEPPLTEDLLEATRARGIRAELVQAPVLGLLAARCLASERAGERWILFIDDDNELASDYVRAGLEFLRHNPEVGCFAGRSHLPAACVTKPWVASFLPYLAVRDLGPEPIKGVADSWAPWEPHGAGMFVAASVHQAVCRRVTQQGDLLALGRVGARSVSSCDDSLLVAQSHGLQLASAYVPQLQLFHHVAPERFRLAALLHLMRGQAKSLLLLHQVLQRPHPLHGGHWRWDRFTIFLALNAVAALRQHSPQFALGLLLYYWTLRTAA